jgi:hypothetical protein
MQMTSIVCLPDAGESLTGCTIDLPRVHEVIDGHVLQIAGWVVGRDTSVVKIEVFHDTHVLTGMPVLLVRPDVTRHLELEEQTLPTGFDLTFSTIGLPETFELSVWVHLADGQPVEFARLRGRHTLLRSPFRPALQPLSVTSLGRTGTTLLMAMLAEHPEICVHRVHPFEMRFGAYWMHVLTVLSGPANHFESSHPDRFQSERLLVGNNPYAQFDVPEPALRSWFHTDAPEELAAFCQRNIDAAYLRLARDQGEGAGPLFAEKNNPTYAARLRARVWRREEGRPRARLPRHDLLDAGVRLEAADARLSARRLRRRDVPTSDRGRVPAARGGVGRAA